MENLYIFTFNYILSVYNHGKIAEVFDIREKQVSIKAIDEDFAFEELQNKLSDCVTKHILINCGGMTVTVVNPRTRYTIEEYQTVGFCSEFNKR